MFANRSVYAHLRRVMCACATLIVLPITAFAEQTSPRPDYRALCSQRGTDVHVDASAYDHGWLLCSTSDAHADGQELFHETPRASGNFAFVTGAGDQFTSNELVIWGVPPATAKALTSRVSAALGAENHKPRPGHEK